MGEFKNKESLDNGSFLFRFRSAKALLDDDPENGGFQELEKQSIYFAHPHQLNDPMEGISDFFWDGDQVLWQNLFRHYALSLYWYAGVWQLTEPEEIDQVIVRTGFTEMDLPTDFSRAIYREFCSTFCSEIESSELANVLGSWAVPFRRSSLIFLLSSIHQTALPILFRVLKKHGLSNQDWPQIPDSINSKIRLVDAWKEIVKKSQSGALPITDQVEVLSGHGNGINNQIILATLSGENSSKRTEKIISLCATFPESYVEAFLRDLHSVPWRVACFSGNYLNASMWGTYGNEHRGAALIFRTERQGDKYSFRVSGIHGTQAKEHPLEVYPVNYQKRPPTLDVFREMGRLPMKKIEESWMTSDMGKLSARLEEMTQDIDSWRDAHWKKIFECITWKHTDWKHEEEQRLIVSSTLTDDPAPEPLTYDFSQLEGIIFGMRMSNSNKVRISELIKAKCAAEGRRDFRFFQAYYSPSKGEMDISELELLKYTQAG